MSRSPATGAVVCFLFKYFGVNVISSLKFCTTNPNVLRQINEQMNKFLQIIVGLANMRSSIEALKSYKSTIAFNNKIKPKNKNQLVRRFNATANTRRAYRTINLKRSSSIENTMGFVNGNNESINKSQRKNTRRYQQTH